MAFLNKIAEQMGIPYDKPFAYTNVSGYDISIRCDILNDSMFLFYIPVEKTSSIHATALIEFLKNNKKTYKMEVVSAHDNLLELKYFSSFVALNGEKMATLLGNLTRELNALGFLPQRTCCFCNGENPDSDAMVNGIKFRSHRSCKEAEISKVDLAQDNEEKPQNNLVGGIFGAIFGAIIGSIPWILVDIFIGYFAAVLGVLIGYSAFYFYKKFGGLVTKNTKYLIIAVTVFGVIFTNLVIATYIIYIAEGAFVIENYLIIYTDPEIAPAMFQSLGLGLLIGVFSLPTIFKRVSSEEKRRAIIK